MTIRDQIHQKDVQFLNSTAPLDILNIGSSPVRLVKRQTGLEELSTPVFGPVAAFSETFSAFRSLFSEVADILAGPRSGH